MQTLASRMRQADTLLAPYAVPHGGGLGRAYPESEDATRFPFQRDRDRIIHTQSFRRLKHKTQVFVSGHGDHYRTRITHTLEVAQISRDIARTLGLNEDLAESIALAHDIGHTPFGHAGEEAMNECLRRYDKQFEHNEQSLRSVTLLERRSSQYDGLNLNREILEGLMKHRTPHDHPSSADIPRGPSLEAQVVNLADEIAYTAHDTDDGLRAQQFSLAAITKTTLGGMAAKRAEKHGTALRGAIVDFLVEDLYAHTSAALERDAIITLEDVYAASKPIVDFSPKMHAHLTGLRSFLWDHLYMSPSVQRQAKRGKRIITALFRAYMHSPPRKVTELRKNTRATLEESVKDYIAGMTDPFAIEALAAVRDN